MIPPPPTRPAPPPPPRATPPWYGEEPEMPPVSPDLTRFDLEAAIWIHGDYPQRTWPEAAKELLRKCRETPFGFINAASLDYLDRHQPIEVDLTYNEDKSMLNATLRSRKCLTK